MKSTDYLVSTTLLFIILLRKKQGINHGSIRSVTQDALW